MIRTHLVRLITISLTKRKINGAVVNVFFIAVCLTNLPPIDPLLECWAFIGSLVVACGFVWEVMVLLIE